MKTRLNMITPNAMLVTTAALCIGMSTGVLAEPFNDRGILVSDTTSAASPGLRTTPTLSVRGFNNRGVGLIPSTTVGSQRAREQRVVTLSGGFNDRGSHVASTVDRYPAESGGNHVVYSR